MRIRREAGQPEHCLHNIPAAGVDFDGCSPLMKKKGMGGQKSMAFARHLTLMVINRGHHDDTSI
jgi:hypothetical protein